MPGTGRDWNRFEITVRPVGEYGFRCGECRYEGRFRAQRLEYIGDRDQVMCPRCGTVREKRAVETSWQMGQVYDDGDELVPVPPLFPRS